VNVAATTGHGVGHCGGTGTIGGDEQVNVPALPVTVTHLPVIRCQICQRTIAYRHMRSSTSVAARQGRRLNQSQIGRADEEILPADLTGAH